MIKANELRIGNLIIALGEDYDQGGNKFHDPDGDDIIIVDIDTFKAIERGSIHYHPIPLTPKWLERCGFNYSAPFYAKRPLVLSKNAVRDGSGNYDGFILRVKIEDGMQHMVIQHLRHLQNIFHSLTGEELNVKQ